MTDSALLYAGAFWKNDEPDGFGVEFHLTGPECVTFVERLQRTIGLYDVALTKEQALDALIEWAANKEAMSADDLMKAFSYILWLEIRGHIESDEYNGVVWIHDVGSMPDILKARRGIEA